MQVSYHTKYTTTHTASDNIHQSKATTERPGLAPSGASLRQSVHLTLDAARRIGSPQTCKTFGRIRSLIPSRSTRPIDTKDNKAPKKPNQAPKNYRVTRAFLCCACLFTVLTSTCTHDPLTEFYPAREIPLPHLADTTDLQDGQQLKDNKEIRREDHADMPR